MWEDWSDPIYSSICRSYANCDVCGQSDVGGLVGYNGGNIEISFSASTVSGSDWVGGLIGANSGNISNCGSVGVVSGEYEIAGFVGRNDAGGTISWCCSAARVEGTMYTGGFVGSEYRNEEDSYLACFWDSVLGPDRPGIGNGTDPNVIAESTANMQTQSTFTSAGWDFVDIWTIDEGEDYPRLVWEVVRRYAGYGVNFGDYCLLAGYWGDEDCESSGNCGGVDVDFSGGIDFTDLRALAQYWLSGY